MTQWKQEWHNLQPGNSWKASPGHNVLVLDEGTVSLEFPDGWVIDPTEDCVRVLDKALPNADCALGVSYQFLPPVDWSRLSICTLVETIEADDDREILDRGPIICGSRPGIEWAWRKMRFDDPVEHRPAISHQGLAIGSGTLCLLTFVFWETDRTRCEPVWDHVLDSLLLGLPVNDPTRGPRLA